MVPSDAASLLAGSKVVRVRTLQRSCDLLVLVEQSAESVAPGPTGAWLAQQAGNLAMNLDDAGRRVRFLIRDRYAKFTAPFDTMFTAIDIRPIRTPVRAPRANAITERFVGASAANSSTAP